MSDPIQVRVPFENVNDPTAKIVDWKISLGTKVTAGDPVVELETTKTTFPVIAPVGGFVEYNLPLGEEVPVGGPLFRIHADELSARAAVAAPLKTLVVPATSVAAPAMGAPMISKRAQDLMATHRLDPSAFPGMSVVKESDVREKIASLEKSASPPVPAKSPEIAAPKIMMEDSGHLIQLERAKQVENRELSQVNHEV